MSYISKILPANQFNNSAMTYSNPIRPVITNNDIVLSAASGIRVQIDPSLSDIVSGGTSDVILSNIDL